MLVSYASAMRCSVLTCYVCYALFGTDMLVSYASAMRCPVLYHPMYHPTHPVLPWYCPRPCAPSGTGIGRYRATPVLRAVRY
eukprot:2569195-Rhodomonas_salina.1